MAQTPQLQSKTSFIFDRSYLHEHPWSTAMNELEISDDPLKRVLCDNICMDHRVSTSREKNMLDNSQINEHIYGKNFMACWKDYFQSEICRPKSVYLENCNDGNRITNRAMGFDLLIHVASLNKILFQLINNEYESATLFDMDFYRLTGCHVPTKSMGGSLDYEKFNTDVTKLAEEIQGKGVDIIKQMAGLLCDTLGDYQPPWWACFAEEVSPYIQSEDWASLCKTLGLGHFSENEWILIG